MGNKFQRYMAIAVITLVVLSIAFKLINNSQKKKVKWEEGDREVLVENCMSDLSGRVVRFPIVSLQYCECFADTMMGHYRKYEYLEVMNKPHNERSEEMILIIKDCYSNFNAGMFDNSDMPD